MTQQTIQRLILVDGSSYLYRAFHAMPALTNSKGFPTGAVYGVINMLKRLLNEYKPQHVAVIFDAKGKTFRDDLYEAYKANRKAMPDELSQQIEMIHELITAMGFPLIVQEGVEADDVIGTLAKQAEAEGIEVLISTGDKDIAQLVNDKITLVNTMTNTILNPASVVEKFGIPPEAIIDYLTLVGDSVDNIPGVPQVGPKTAVKWLLEYKTLDNIISNADKISGKVGENLRNSLAHLPLSKELATIKLDVKLNYTHNELLYTNPNNARLIELFKELEFKNWLSELLDKAPKATEDKYANYETILSQSNFEKWLAELASAKIFAIDTETTSLNYMEAEIVGLCFATAPGKATYLPLTHQYENVPQQLNKETVLAQLKPILENPNIKKVCQHMKYDVEVLANVGIAMQGVAYDTMLESYVLDSSSNRHDLESLALKHLGWRMIPYEEVAGKGAKQVCFDQVKIETASVYASEDADVTLRLHELLWEKLAKDHALKYVFEKIEMPLVPVLARMERHGVLIDVPMLNQQTEKLEQRLSELEKEIVQQAGCTFNLNSPKQLQEILFTQLKLPVLQKTPTGQPSTADPVLQELALEYDLPKFIIEYRALTKLMTTYTKKLPEQVNPKTQRVHTSYHQTGAVTGRLSSSDPNLQNIPVRMAEGRLIRQAFIVPKGYKMISADYSQIELRLMAHISEDPNLLKAFELNLDVHQATAAEVLGIPLEQVSSEERRRAKAINFGLIYGMSAFGLAKQLGIDRNMAQDYINRYFARYPKVLAYMEATRQKAHAKGYVETLSGRRLYLPEINSSQMMRQKAAERAAINAPLQGSAADLIKQAMISLDQWIQTHDTSAKMLMQVHDELVFEVKEDEVPAMIEVIREHMMGAAKLKVPLLVSIGCGDNWDAASGH